MRTIADKLGRIFALIVTALALLFSSPMLAAPIEPGVIKVIDGDTITVDGKRYSRGDSGLVGERSPGGLVIPSCNAL